MTYLRPAIVSLLVFTGLLGVVYPLAVGVAARVVPQRAPTVGQPVTDPASFWGRPSAIAYDATTSSGTNAGPTGFVDRRGTLGPNPVLVDAVKARIAALRAVDPGNTTPVPVDLVTASASGLDPHISPAAAYYQVGRVARARGLPEARVRALVDAHVEERTLGVLGERRVNVVRLDRALDALTR